MKVVIAIVAMSLLAVLSGCCTKKYCYAVEGITVSFENYDNADLDTLLITGYKKNTNFGEVSVHEQLDSINRDEDDSYAYYHLGLNNDWEVYIPATGQRFRFRYYEMKPYKCNSCFLRKDEYQSLGSFNVNGVQISGSTYNIAKP